MINFQALRLMHHDSADHDPERSWIRGARIFKCDTCSDEVIVVPPDEEPGNTKIE